MNFACPPISPKAMAINEDELVLDFGEEVACEIKGMNIHSKCSGKVHRALFLTADSIEFMTLCLQAIKTWRANDMAILILDGGKWRRLR